jgi:2-dehydropantoate 2-reductase
MKACFVGAGALGSALGGTLAAGGLDVQLVDSWQEHVAAINGAGLLLREGGEEKRIAVKAANSCAGLAVADLVIIAVKSFDTRAAARAAAPVVGPATVLLSLQNGLGHEEILVEIFGRERVMAGKTYAGGALIGPGQVQAGTRGKETIIGELDGILSERALRIAEAFEKAGLKTQASARIMGAMWDKLLINVATGALTAITGLPYGPLQRVPEIEDCALEAVREAVQVACASGITLSSEDPRVAWSKAAAGLPEGFKPSMLQSVEKQQRTEIDFINGTVVRWGERCGVPTPVNKTLVACVKGLESRFP